MNCYKVIIKKYRKRKKIENQHKNLRGSYRNIFLHFPRTSLVSEPFFFREYFFPYMLQFFRSHFLPYKIISLWRLYTLAFSKNSCRSFRVSVLYLFVRLWLSSCTVVYVHISTLEKNMIMCWFCTWRNPISNLERDSRS